MAGFVGLLIVNITVLLICFIAYSSQIFVIWPWYGRVVSVQLITLLVPFNMLVGMLFWNYFLTVNTEPGSVPDTWKPNANEDGYEVKKITGGPRYCRMCEKYKPPRTHHCRQCDRCVLRMDHHCPWVNNCVGHFNYGYFLRFLFFVDLACTYHLAMVTARVLDETSAAYWDAISATELVFIILNYVTCIPVILAVGGFSLYHFSSLMSNTTTIESWEKDRATTMVRKGKLREVQYPYHLGRLRNIESVLGENPLLWWWPLPAFGNGLKYDINHNEEGHELSEWPPLDPADAQVQPPPDNRFTLPDSPWTYGDTINPELQPSNSSIRTTKRRVKRGHHSTLPPYHPDYQEGASSGYDYEDSDSSMDDEESRSRNMNMKDSKMKVRRGSEGYEVRPAGREDMLHRYLEEIGETPGRYHRYIPQPESESEEDDEEDEDEDEEDVKDVRTRKRDKLSDGGDFQGARVQSGLVDEALHGPCKLVDMGCGWDT